MTYFRVEANQAICPTYRVSLGNGNLIWEYEIKAPLNPNLVDIDKCLEDFEALADSGDGAVHAFVKKYGVLGILPTVTVPKDHASGRLPAILARKFFYKEPTSIYQQLALQCNAIRRIMECFRSGRRIDPSVFLQCFPSSQHQAVQKDIDTHRWKTRSEIYEHLVSATMLWSNASCYRFRLRPSNAGNGRQAAFVLDFGGWADGIEWDRQTLENTGEDDDDPFFELLSKDDLPSRRQRPSPLFNILAFQLLNAVTLPEGTYFCSQCNEPYQPNREKGDRKPRCDKETQFCCDDHRDEYKKAYDRRRYEARTQKKEDLQPNL